MMCWYRCKYYCLRKIQTDNMSYGLHRYWCLFILSYIVWLFWQLTIILTLEICSFIELKIPVASDFVWFWASQLWWRVAYVQWCSLKTLLRNGSLTVNVWRRVPIFMMQELGTGWNCKQILLTFLVILLHFILSSILLLLILLFIFVLSSSLFHNIVICTNIISPF